MKEPILMKAGDKRVLVNGYPLPVNYRIVWEENYQELKKAFDMRSVVVMLPEPKEIELRLKKVVYESFEDSEVVEKREYSLGFRACYNWLKIKQMKAGN